MDMTEPSSPSSRPPRTRRKEARPGEIATAALRLFAEKGFASTRLEDVAAAAGIGKGTIYLYFATKQDLFEAVVRQAIVPKLEAAEAALAAYDGFAADLLRRCAVLAADAIGSDLTAIPKLVLTELGNFPEMARFYGETVVNRGLDLLGRVLAHGIARGEFRPVPLHAVAPLVVGPVLMLVMWKHSLAQQIDIRFEPSQVLAAHVEVILRGLRAEDGP